MKCEINLQGCIKEFNPDLNPGGLLYGVPTRLAFSNPCDKAHICPVCTSVLMQAVFLARVYKVPNYLELGNSDDLNKIIDALGKDNETN